MKKHDDIDLGRSLFPLAFTVLRRNWLPCGIGAVLPLLLNVGEGFFPATVPFVLTRALVIMIVGYSIYRTLLSGGRLTGLRAMATDDGRVPWRYAGVMLMILTPILILGIVWNAPGGAAGPDNLPELAFGLGMISAYTVGYVLLGTALPEVAARGDVALSEAIDRGRMNYREIGKSMVLGPWMFRAMAVLAIVGLAVLGVPTDLFHGSTGAFQPTALGPMLLLGSAHVFAEVLTAIVLTRAYLAHPVAARAVAVRA